MDPVKIYDYLVLARGKLLDWTRPLSAEQYHRAFAIGPGSLAKVLTHTLQAEWYYVHRIEGQTTRITGKPPVDDEAPPAFSVLESAWAELTKRTRAAIVSMWGAAGSGRGWMTPRIYERYDNNQQVPSITATPADIFTQLAFHEVHHRAQAMNILRQLGVTNPPPEDLDYNNLTYSPYHPAPPQ